MIRTQVQLTEVQQRAVRSLAVREGVSFSEALRRCVDRGLDTTGAEARAARFDSLLALGGQFRDVAGRRDLSAAHDALFDESLE